MQAMAIEAEASVRFMMLHGYNDPHPNRKGGGFHTEIYDTGALFNDVRAEIDGDDVHIGNTLYYAQYVHDGTHKLRGRPYITDGITTVADFESVVAKELKKGM